MKTIKVDDATNTQLNWLAHNLLHPDEPIKEGCTAPPYTTDWAFGGPLIETQLIQLHLDYRARDGFISNGWGAPRWQPSTTALVAVVRCYVFSQMGLTVEVPEELS
jgi:hypothetical protein